MSMTEAMRFALETSVLKEQEAYDFYAAAARKVENRALRELFEELAGDELGHRDFLIAMLEERSRVETIKPQKHDYKLAEEVIDVKPELTVDMPFADAIAMAIKREEEAMQTYDELASEADDDEMRTLFVNLRNMEQSHKTALESVYMNVAYAEVW